MSYEIVKSINIRKDGISITSACNNVRPLHFSKWEFKASTDQKENFFQLFLDIMNGNLHLQKSASKRLRYAMHEVNKWLIAYQVNSYDTYCNQYRYMYETVAKRFNKDFEFRIHDYSTEYSNKQNEIYDLFKANYTEEEQEQLRSESQHKVYDTIYEIFLKYYEEYKEDNQKYVISLGYGRYLKKMNTCTYRYCYDIESAKQYSKLDAEVELEGVRSGINEDAVIVRLEG